MFLFFSIQVYFDVTIVFFFYLFRFEHSKSVKKEELPATQTLPLASASQENPSDPEPRGISPGSGAQDWVNAAEFVPGQPYCGRGEYTAPGICSFVETLMFV